MAKLKPIGNLRLFFCATTALTCAGISNSSFAEDTIAEALQTSKPILESRLRFENVTQAGLRETGALTWRNRAGFQSGEFKGLKLLVEIEDVRALDGDYNSNLNGKTAFAVVADPEVTEVNRLQLTWTPTAYTTITVGRQRIALDDQRFIGTVGWRQDEQTFDAARIDTAIGKLKLTYAYITQVNRVLAEDRDWDSQSHVLNATYSISEALKLQAFDYALEFDNAAASSTNTYGVRATGSLWASMFKLAYAAQYAEQKDYANNPADFKLAQYSADVSATYDIFTAKLNYEVLEGNGTQGFITPLGMVHAFQGWSDVFSANGGNKTHVNGIKDMNFSLIAATHTKVPWLMNPTFTVIYRDLETERTGQALGTEWDALATAGLTKNLSLVLKYADFERANTLAPASRTKLWVGLEYKL
ncbi:alginate export family protein [Asticcacaulis sp. ZE23SCel15]|uniref:alginate export family protein n=1 Tax=Asticcacaulis sp. ZE23SCel15 TaxID=3059027 RepID=UPI00266009B7|nr:alginate export family protein [Asticcacaulis sp. ZE23SCel15]WKL58688.1 alginate export family protein [Asticcacaulis sp. ZE23SCel15]